MDTKEFSELKLEEKLEAINKQLNNISGSISELYGFISGIVASHSMRF